MAIKILRLQQVREITGLSRSEIYRRMQARDFPQRVFIGVRAVGWPEDEINEWTIDRITNHRRAA